MRPLYLIIGLLLLFSCGKEDAIVIDGNTPPPDRTIETVIVENYVNKLYISMLGREPSTPELSNALETLGENAPIENREALVDAVQSNPEYYGNLFNLFRQDYLDGIDTMEIHYDYIDVYESLIEMESNPLALEIYETGLVKLQVLYNTGIELSNANINAVQAHLHCVDNAVYDDINMGTENYVISMFQNFLHRYPTVAELKTASVMVDNEQSNCFGVNGDSKDDFNALFFNHDGYFEGQVISVFNNLLYRTPNSEESTALAGSYKKNRDYKALQKALLIGDEFMGINQSETSTN